MPDEASESVVDEINVRATALRMAMEMRRTRFESDHTTTARAAAYLRFLREGAT